MDKNKLHDSTQSQRDKFTSTARELGCDESEERFDAALGKIVKHKPAAEPGPPKKPSSRATR